MAENGAQVLIVMGSASDSAVMERCKKTLEEFGVGCEYTVASAHRSPERAMKLAGEASGRGIKIIVAAAGMAAHLAGVIASHADLPVIGVPMDSGAIDGLDALLATVQMPPGVPVATMGIGKAGATNAAHLAIRILALSDPGLAQKIKEHKKKMAEGVEAAAREVERR